MNKAPENKTNLKIKSDSIFKAIFGSKTGKPLLETLLRDILKKEVEIIEYKNRELPKISASSYSKIIRFRNFVYFAGVILLDHEIGGKYKAEQKYISINLTAKMGKKHEVIEIYKLQNDKQEEYIDNIKVYEVNIDKAKEEWYKGDKRKEIRHIAAIGMS